MDKFAGEPFFRAIIDAIPSPLFVVDCDVKIIAFNRAAMPLLGEPGARVLLTRAGEVLHCINATKDQGGCGRAEACTTCVVRNSVGDAIRQQRVMRKFQRMELVGPTGTTPVYLLVTTAPLEYGGMIYSTLLLEDVGDLVEARGLLPVCMLCHRIREGDDYWSSVEAYFKKHLDMDFSHGLCPDCLRKHYPEVAAEILG